MVFSTKNKATLYRFNDFMSSKSAVKHISSFQDIWPISSKSTALQPGPSEREAFSHFIFPTVWQSPQLIRSMLGRAQKMSYMAPKSSLTAIKLHRKALMGLIYPMKRYEIPESMIMGRYFERFPAMTWLLMMISTCILSDLRLYNRWHYHAWAG